MYKSPIEIIQDQLRIEQEGEILRAVQNTGVNVDKEELIRALQYDRGQYDKGFRDGKAYVVGQVRQYLLAVIEEWTQMDDDRKYRLENMQVYNHIRKELDDLEAFATDLLGQNLADTITEE